MTENLDVCIAMNYIPASMFGGKNSNERPTEVWIKDEIWVLKDKYLITAHYERKENEILDR